MKTWRGFTAAAICGLMSLGAAPAFAICPYDIDCLNNPYGSGSPYKPDGLMNPYSRYGSPYSSGSWTNPYATNAPKIYDENGNYKGRLSTNPYDSVQLPLDRKTDNRRKCSTSSWWACALIPSLAATAVRLTMRLRPPPIAAPRARIRTQRTLGHLNA
jgi:hypothetical protein